MSHRGLAVVVTVIMGAVLMPIPAAQSVQEEPPRTSWGKPDLAGVWEYKTRTRLERPERYGDREFLTEEEAAEIERNEIERSERQNTQDISTKVIPDADSRPGRWLDTDIDGAPGSYNSFWFDWGTSAVSTRRTSLVVDPPNGRLPAKTEAGQERAKTMGARSSFSDTVGSAASHLQFSNSDRCLMSGNAGPPMLPGVYNNNMQLFQAEHYVAILNEMIHTIRIIPLDGRPSLTPAIRQFVGDSRGHWDGETLVIETANFNDDTVHSTWRSTSTNMKLVERFTRVDADTLLYEFTVDDHDTWERSWSAELPMHRQELGIYEFACHEGNYGLPNILTGNRFKEAEAAAK